jgi:triphosphatase
MPALEFCVPQADTARLLRLPSLTRRTGRPATVDRVWHDTADGALEAEGLSLSAQKGTWRLERSRPVPGVLWPPGTPAPLIEEAADLGAIGRDLHMMRFGALREQLMPLAGFRGRQRAAVLDDGAAPVEMLLLEGALRGVTQERPVCRLLLTGPGPRLQTLSSEIGDAIGLAAPRWSLAAEAIALARGIDPAARQVGAPAVPSGTSLRDAVALVLSHLTDVILAGASPAPNGHSPEPVHQMRVAVRRLRSALSIFRRAVESPALEAVKPGLKQLASVLGAARDWDVFLAGTAHAVSDALPGDRRIGAMLEAGERRRVAAYAALGRYLTGGEFHALEVALVQLAALRPWEAEASEEQVARLGEAAGHFASHQFERRLEHILAPGPDISNLPVEELHTIRKQGKRLRYAAEFFSPLYGKRSARRFIGRLSTLQEALGHLNDTAAAGDLMASLGQTADRQFAAGAVQGFVAARQGDTRRDIGEAWSKFRRQEPFWT